MEKMHQHPQGKADGDGKCPQRDDPIKSTKNHVVQSSHKDYHDTNRKGSSHFLSLLSYAAEIGVNGYCVGGFFRNAK